MLGRFHGIPTTAPGSKYLPTRYTCPWAPPRSGLATKRMAAPLRKHCRKLSQHFVRIVLKSQAFWSNLAIDLR